MRQISLPEHLAAWCESQVVAGRYASAGTYLAQLINEDRLRLEAIEQLRVAINAARESGISMRDPEGIFTIKAVPAANPQTTALRQAIQQARAGGYSSASIEGIMYRAIGAPITEAA